MGLIDEEEQLEVEFTMSVSCSSSWTRTLFFSSLFLFELDEEDLIEEECQTAEEEQEEEEEEDRGEGGGEG